MESVNVSLVSGGGERGQALTGVIDVEVRGTSDTRASSSFAF